VLVTNVYNDSPAEKAGVQRGDVVLQIGDFPVNDPQAMRYRIATRMIGEKVQMSVIRRGLPVQLAIQLEAPPNEPKPDETYLTNFSPFSGAKVASLSPALAEDLGLDSGIAGVVVLDVISGSAAQRVGLKPGDIVRALDNRLIGTVQELEAFRPRAFQRWSMVLTRMFQSRGTRNPSPVRSGSEPVG
jgi:serine protease Do